MRVRAMRCRWWMVCGRGAHPRRTCVSWHTCVHHCAPRESERDVLKNVCRAVCVNHCGDSQRCVQCSTFTGILPVFGVFLILFRWYWYVV